MPTVEEWSLFSDGQEYYSKTWHPKNKFIATVLFIHGLGEHVNRYDHVFEVFSANGIKTLAFDQRGFGKTGKKSGIIGHNGGIKRVVQDIEEVNARIQVQGKPHFIFGHR